MTPAQIAHIMALVDAYTHVPLKQRRAAIEAALRDAPQAEIDAITELNHAQWLALENVRTLAARNRKEEWAQHLLRWCTEAGNAARILRSTPSASTAVEPGERAMFEAWYDKWILEKAVHTKRENDLWEAWQARASKGTPL